MSAAKVGWACAFACVAACGGANGDGAGTDAAADDVRDADAMTDGDAGADAVADADADGVADGVGVAVGASLIDRTFVCKLINGASLEDPSGNHTQTRFNLTGTDLGVPLVTGASFHLFFGDTMGYRVIWRPGEDPDSVAHVPLASMSADVATLCDALDFYVTADDPSVAHSTDPTILRDFAGSYMTAPAGGALADFIAQHPPGFPNIPGTFEVPTGAIAVGGKAYVFYAGLVEKTPATRATLSYLARWDAPGASAPGYQILYPIDRLAAGALGGHFIQIAPVESAGMLYAFGTGDFRRSGIRLARKPIAQIDAAGGEELFDPTTRTWTAAASMSQSARDAIAPLVEGDDGVGELSVQWIEGAGVFLLMYQRELHGASGAITDNRVIVRVARAPEGPWSDAVTIVDMADPAFRAAHCCDATCGPSQILHCDRAGLYGAYALPFAQVVPKEDLLPTIDLPFLVSTWDPYDVVLFRTRIQLQLP